MALRTGYAYHEIFGWHDTGTNAGFFPSDPALGLQPFVNYENAETKRRIHELIVVSKLIDHLEKDIYCRLAPSKVAGIGVFAIREIPQNINPFTHLFLGKEPVIKLTNDEITVFNEFCRRNTEIKIFNLTNAGITDDYMKLLLIGLKLNVH